MKIVNFTEMKKGTKEEYLLLDEYEQDYISGTADRILEFMKGYESVRALKVDESKYLNVSLRLASLRFWLSRLEDFHNVKEGEITFIKNPNHFKNILLDRQKEQNYAN